jgi:hypothetical protein
MDDPVSAYGYDSGRRRSARRAAQWTANMRRFRVSLLIMLTAIAALAVVTDRLSVRPDLAQPPVQGHATDVTTTLAPHPAKITRHR